MRKSSLRSEPVSSTSAYVDDAADFAKALTWAEAKCPGDYANAMERAARRARVSKGLLWRLHYRKPKQVAAADFVNLGTECGKRGLHRTERANVAPRTALGRWLVEAADKIDRFADAMGGPETLGGRDE